MTPIINTLLLKTEWIEEVASQILAVCEAHILELGSPETIKLSLYAAGRD